MRAEEHTHYLGDVANDSLVYNAATITFALLGHIKPLVAAIIMPLSSAISLGFAGLGLRGRS